MAAGGSVLLLSAAAVALWPRTYGSEATFVVEGAVANPAALAARVEATLLEREELSRAAIELPPELRSPDPIGKLRAGLRVQSRGPLGYVVEFRGSEPKSVQRIANLLADRAVALVPAIAAAPRAQAPAQALAARTRAVTEFLTAHPEVTVDRPTDGKVTTATDSGLEALRTEKRQIEQRIATGAKDNPYTDPEQSPENLNRRLAELKNTITRREKALKESEAGAPRAASGELVAQWRQLLAELAAAQTAESLSSPEVAPVAGRVTARAPLPTSPLTPNRLLLSIVAALLSAAAALVAYVLPRKAEPRRPQPSQAPRTFVVSEAPLPPSVGPSLPPSVVRGELPPWRGEPLTGSEPPPPPQMATQMASPRPSSEPPGGITVQRTVVLTGSSSPSGTPRRARSNTDPGGLQAPTTAVASASSAPSGASVTHAPPAAPLFGSRPPPGAGSYSVSSSHPPPLDSRGGASRTSVEKLSPLPSAHPPASVMPPAVSSSPSRTSVPPAQTAQMPQIVSRPPALDPEAESWAADFEPPPAAAPTRPTHPQPTPAESVDNEPRKQGGRWKTQVMGSMVPLEVMAAREEVPPPSRAIESGRSRPMARQVASASATTVVYHDVPLGWTPAVDSGTAEVTELRDAVLQVATGVRVTLLVTGTARAPRALVASALGLALANAGARTLLVEADFDHPELHRALSLSAPPGAGFSQQLMARRSARHPEPWTILRCSANLSVLPEGRFRSPGLVVSREFESALTDLGEQHHIVILHAPSLSQADDLRPLTGLAQGAVLVEPNKPSQLRLGDAVRALV